MIDNELFPESGYRFSLANRVCRNKGCSNVTDSCLHIFNCFLIPANDIVKFGFSFPFSKHDRDIFFLCI